MAHPGFPEGCANPWRCAYLLFNNIFSWIHRSLFHGRWCWIFFLGMKREYPSNRGLFTPNESENESKKFLWCWNFLWSFSLVLWSVRFRVRFLSVWTGLKTVRHIGSTDVQIYSYKSDSVSVSISQKKWLKWRFCYNLRFLACCISTLYSFKRGIGQRQLVKTSFATVTNIPSHRRVCYRQHVPVQLIEEIR